MPNGNFPPPLAQTPRPGRTVARVPLEDALLGIATARRAADRLRITHEAAPLLALAAALEAALPGTVPQSVLARALGVTPQALKRWVRSGRLPLAVEREGERARPGVPAAAAVVLVERVEALRSRSRGRRRRRPLALALGDPRLRNGSPPQ